MRWFYPAIKPKEYARRKVAFEQARVNLQSDFMNTVLERGEAQTDGERD